MSFADGDKEYLKLVIYESIGIAMKPVMDKLAETTLDIQKHEQTLYGTNGENGLSGDNKKQKAFQRTIVFFFAVLQALQFAFGAYIFLTKNL